MFWTILLFAVGLVCLIKGGDWFVDGAAGVAKRFRLPELLIGATVVSIGTTLPEVMVSATSAAEGYSGIAYGNAIGSIICNAALIAAIPIIARPGKVNAQTFRTPVLFFFGAEALYIVVSYAVGRFDRPIGIALLLLFVIYMIVTVLSMKRGQAPAVDLPEEEPEEEKKSLWPAYAAFRARHPLAFQIADLIVGAALIALGARLLVDNGTKIAEALGVPQSVIALTFVALGTSLPELVTAITALVKGHDALSLGNVVGANLFNLVLVSGTAIAIRPFDIPAETRIFGLNASLVLDVPVSCLVMLILTLPALLRGKLSRLQGILLLLIYIGYCALQFILPALAA